MFLFPSDDSVVTSIDGWYNERSLSALDPCNYAIFAARLAVLGVNEVLYSIDNCC